jgi:Ca2+-binding EF-hand superfamily protein
LKEILSIINTTIKSKNIDVNNLIKQYDKNSTGFIGNHEFNEFIKSLDIEELNNEDINFLKPFLEKDEKNNIKYKNFIMIIKD